MPDALLYAIPLAMLGVVAALALGLTSFTREGAEHRARSNRYMQWRVGLQFLAVGLIMLAIFLAGRG